MFHVERKTGIVTSPNLRYGYTVCVMYAIRCSFPDGSLRVVVENSDFVKVRTQCILDL